jgi:hypothetical protein
MPMHKPRLKASAVITLLQNLISQQGLRNGTRLTVLQLQGHTVDFSVTINNSHGQAYDKICLKPLFSHGLMLLSIV